MSSILVACGKSEPPAADNQTEAQTEVKDQIVFGIQGDATTLDPQAQNDTTTGQYCRALFATLFVFDEEGTPKPYMIKDDYSVSEDGCTWTFTLIDGLKFAKGNAITSADVAATFTRMVTDKTLIGSKYLSGIESVTAINDKQFEIKTNEPYGPLLSGLCLPAAGIMDKDYLSKYDKDTLNTTAEATNASGCFTLVKWVRNSEVVMERNENFFGEKAKTKTLIFKPIKEASSRVMALEGGEVDIATYLSADQVKTLKDSEGIKISKISTNGQRCFRFGCNDKIISNPLVRQALIYAIDREAINKALFGDLYVETTGAMTPGSFGYVDLGPVKQDKAKAKELLAKAGYPDGFKTKIVTCERYANAVQIAEIMKSQLAEIGVDAEIQVMEWSAIQATWTAQTAETFDEPIFVMGLACYTRDADAAYNHLYTTSPDGTNTDSNYGFYSNAEVDALVAKAEKSVDPNERSAAYKRIAEIIYMEDPIGIWIHDQVQSTAYMDKLTGLEIDASGFYHFDNAQITN